MITPAPGIVRRAGEARRGPASPLVAGLTLAFCVIALVRALLFVGATPMQAYGNNWDQVRYTACFHVFPHGPEVTSPGTASPDRPPTVATWLPTVDGPCIWTSDALFDAGARLWLGAVARGDEAPATMPIHAIGWARLALALLWLGYLTWRLWQVRPALACGIAAAFAIVLPDPANLLWVNTFYAEFTGVTALLASIALLLLAAAGVRGAGLGAMQLVAAVLLAMAKVQFGALPLALWLGAAIALVLAPRKVATIALPYLAGALIGLAGQCLQLARDDAEMRLWQQVTTANVVMNGVLGASDDPVRTTALLGLPAHCATLAGYHWFNVPKPFAQACPEVFALRRSRIAWQLLVHEPGTLARLGANAVASLDPWVQTELGHVAGEAYGDVTRTHFSFGPWLAAAAPFALLLLAAPLLFVIAALVRREWRYGGNFGAWTGAWLACATIAQQLVITAFGDGVHDLSRQAFLVYGAALTWLVASAVGGVARAISAPRGRAGGRAGVPRPAAR